MPHSAAAEVTQTAAVGQEKNASMHNESFKRPLIALTTSVLLLTFYALSDFGDISGGGSSLSIF